METDEPKKVWKRAVHNKWSPTKPGEYIEGKFIRIDKKTGMFGRYDVALFQALDGSLWTSNAIVLMTQLKDFDVQPGDEVKFVYLGDTESSEGNPYSKFELWVTEMRVIPTKKVRVE
jgi:hypothetical protein